MNRRVPTWLFWTVVAVGVAIIAGYGLYAWGYHSGVQDYSEQLEQTRQEILRQLEQQRQAGAA